MAELNVKLVDAQKETVRVTSVLQEAKLSLSKHRRERDGEVEMTVDYHIIYMFCHCVS